MARPLAARDYYSVLGVARTASAQELQQAYRRMALLHHPDKNPGRTLAATEEFKLVAEAYSVLRDRRKRAEYDRHVWPAGAGCPSGGFSVAMAMDLFRETFGSELAGRVEAVARDVAPHVRAAADAVAPHMAKVARHAAPHVRAAAEAATAVLTEAADRCSRSEMVCSVVKAGFDSMVADADQEVERSESKAAGSERMLERREAELDAHEAACLKEDERRRQQEADAVGCAFSASAHAACGTSLIFVLCLLAAQAMAWWPLQVLGAFAPCQCILVLRAVSRWWFLLQLRGGQRELCEAERRQAEALRCAMGQARRQLVADRAAVGRARGDAEDARRQVQAVDSEGISLGTAARAGLHFAGKLVQMAVPPA